MYSAFQYVVKRYVEIICIAMITYYMVNTKEFPTLENMTLKWHKDGAVLLMTCEKKSVILISSTSGFKGIRLFLL